MNYTGNPRRLRSIPGSSQRTLLHRQRLRTPVIPERPQLDICQSFQAQTKHSTTESQSVVTSSTGGSDSFEAKRRRLLQQKDWLGLDLSAPIKIYDIRDAKERKRRANGPFIKPISYQTTELDTTVTSAPRTSQTPRSPSVASKSSTSLRAEPTLPSIHSSDHGPGFIPSLQSSPLLAEKGSRTSKSTTSKASWNPFLGATQTAIPDVPFIPDSNQDLEFFTRSRSRDTDLDRRNEWKLFEERKEEDQGLLAELGWRSCSTSGISGSQSSQQDPASQSRDLISNVHGEHGQLELEHCPTNGSRRPRVSTSEQARIYTPLQMNRGLLNIPDDGPLSQSTETSGGRQTLEMEGPAVDEAGLNESNTFLMEDQVGQLSVVVHEVEQCLANESVKATKKDIEDEDDNDDEGMPWF